MSRHDAEPCWKIGQTSISPENCVLACLHSVAKHTLVQDRGPGAFCTPLLLPDHNTESGLFTLLVALFFVLFCLWKSLCFIFIVS